MKIELKSLHKQALTKDLLKCVRTKKSKSTTNIVMT